MRVYKMKLKGYDLFYQPTSSSYGGQRSNLSRSGKIYSKKPALPKGTTFISKTLRKEYTEIQVEKVGYYRNQWIISKPEWELKAFELKEIED